AVKNSAYLLPHSEDTLEDFEWLRREIQQGGGEGWLFRCSTVAGLSDDTVKDGFRRLRSADYVALATETRAALEAPAAGQFQKLKRRLGEVCGIDFFDAPGREEVEILMSELEKVLHLGREAPAAAENEYRGRVWVTRRGIKVDRIGSAWLIRRFIDPAARFVFADPSSYRPAPGELRFDMFEGEFTHEGELCSFEVLLRLTGANDPALAAVAEIVHDIDLKDSRYQRPETAGISALIDGIAAQHSDDVRRL